MRRDRFAESRVILIAACLALAALISLDIRGAIAKGFYQVPFPPAPDPSECVVAPVSEDALRALPAGVPATPLTTPADPTSALALFPNPGSVAPAARQAIEAVVQQFMACVNAGDARRAAALYTRSYLERIVAASGDRLMEYFPPEPEPQDALDWESASVRDVRPAGDGRLVALVDGCESDAIVWFRREDGEWRIDDSIDLYEEGVEICGAVPYPTRTPVP